MKRAVISVVILILFLCGCGGSKKTATPVTKGISFTADVTYYNECYTCEVNVDEAGLMSAEVISPDELKGVKLKFDGENVTAEYLGLTYTLKTDTMPLGNVALSIYKVFTDIANNGLSAEYSEENCLIENKVDGEKYEFCFSPAGLPLSLKIPNKEFLVIFSNVAINKDGS
ncbi:MAG: hypothetical protein IJZ75_05625 [Clostridia bacterium]|nr:hypothetical protein [Clostridia bacterium]